MAANDTPPPGAGRRFDAAWHTVAARATRVLRSLVLYGLVAGLSIGAGLAIVQLADEYGYHPARNTTAWAAQPVQYAVSSTCATCHTEHATAIAQRGHGSIDCQACHPAAAEHALTGDATTAAAVRAVTDAAACLVCHEAGLGRPVAFAVVAEDVHFGPAPCLVCHDPHSTVAPAPPRVRHSLDRLPACTVCHGPDGLRPMPAAHPVWSGDCLVCHLRGGATT